MKALDFGIRIMIWARREWLTPTHAAVLLVLSDGASRTKKEIADSISVRLSPIIERDLSGMCEHGLIVASGANKDAYSITPEGMRAIKRLNKYTQD